MTAAVKFHPQGHKYFLAPDFSTVALSDEARIATALEYVLNAKKRSLPGPQKQLLLRKIEAWAGGVDVASLRAAAGQADWKTLQIPAIARVYLRHLLQQSCNLTRQQMLECDFNNGLEIDWLGMQDNISAVLGMGFTRDMAMEALIVCDRDINKATQYLLKDENQQAIERKQARDRLGQFVTPDRHYTVLEQRKRENADVEAWRMKSRDELEQEMADLKRQIEDEKQKRKNLTGERDLKIHKRRMALFVEFLRGLVAEDTVNVTELSQLEQWKTQREITEDDTLEALRELDLTAEQFDALKKFNDTQQYEDECIVCMEPPKDHMLMPCNHVALCPDCADMMRDDDDAKCPLCDVKIDDIRQVFW